ncbi:MAG: hypothetical protein QME58_10050 [Bacteroidota bacterium]|nr:hypothetical protein [Bacteroidota bacterium]
MLKKGMNESAIKEITGRTMKVVKEYVTLYYNFHPTAKYTQ